jgi:tetratricopeptide (TPR) repeat protein
MVKGPAPFDQGLFLMHLHKGKEYFEQNEFQKAREELEAAYNLRPQDEKVLNLLGMSYFKLEMLPQAEEMYVTLAANNPEIYTLQSNLGLIRLKLNKLDQAEESLTNALELQPTNPKAHFYLGLLYEKLQKWDKALVHFEHAKAEKMIAKMKQKLSEVSKDEELLPFEVLEILAKEEAYAQQQQFEPGYMPDALVAEKLAYSREEAPYASDKEVVAAESEWVERNVSTGKMRRRDVIEALERLEQRENDPMNVMDDAVPMQDTVEEHLWADPIQASDEVPAEEPSDQEQPEVEQESEHPGSNGEDSEFLQSSESSASFLLAEETAADISTFLAQSRMDQDEEVSEEEVDEEMSSPILSMTESLSSPDDFAEEEETSAREQDSNVEEESSFEKDVEGPFEEDTPLVEESPAESEQVLDDISEMSSSFSEPKTIDETQMMSAIIGDSASLEDTAVPIPKEKAKQPELPPAAEVEVSVFAGERKLDPEPPAYQATNLDQFSRDRFHVQPLIGADRFLLIDPHLLEIIIAEKLICRKGTISSFTGNLQFQPLPEEATPFVQVAGTGVLFLADRRQEIFIVSLNNESIYVETNHLIVAQSALKVEPHSFEQRSGEKRFSFMKISGRGTIALTCQTKPLTLNVFEAMPANIPADAIIAWSGKLTPSSVADDELRNIMASGQDLALLRFTGNGDVVVEQGGLWGDRRSKQ